MKRRVEDNIDLNSVHITEVSKMEELCLKKLAFEYDRNDISDESLRERLEDQERAFANEISQMVAQLTSKREKENRAARPESQRYKGSEGRDWPKLQRTVRSASAALPVLRAVPSPPQWIAESPFALHPFRLGSSAFQDRRNSVRPPRLA